MKIDGEIDWSDVLNTQHGYDVSKAREFKKELTEMLERYDLIYIGKERAAGKDYDPDIHDNSDTVVDRLVPIIVSEYIHMLKETAQGMEGYMLKDELKDVPRS